MKKKTASLHRMPLCFPIDLSKMAFDENGKPPSEIQVLPTGKWNHPAYGPMVIESSDITQFKKNFDAGLRRDIPITEGHETFDEKPAIGWFKELIDKGVHGLFATVEWTAKGTTLLSERAYKYFSPEFYTEYDDPESREVYKDVLVGGALTNKPYFREMQAVVLSEQSIKNPSYYFTDNTTMATLQDVLAKKVEELTPEDIQLLKDNKDTLTTEQLATFGSVFEDAAEGEKEEKKEGDGDDAAAKAKAEADAAADEGKAADADEKVASEKGFIKMSASEAKALRDMANKGAQAHRELRESKIKSQVSALVFSEQNSKGKILPKDDAKVFSFMLGLSDAQRKTFCEIVDSIPASKLFAELGSDNAVQAGTVQAELESRIQKVMSEDKAMHYSDALRKVITSDKVFAKRYDEETKATR